MALYYLETSALVKLYVQEAGTNRLLQLAALSAGHRFAVLSISRVEFHSAVRRRQREGDIQESGAKRLLTRFDRHMESRFIRIQMNEALADSAIGLLGRHDLRAYDAVQLSGCLALRTGSGSDEPTFVCSDLRLLQAAKLEGLLWLDPSAP